MGEVLLVYTILVLIVTYGQLVLSHSDPYTFRCARLGACSINPGKSSRDIYDNNKDSHGHSGYYWIETDKVYKIYCDMELSCGGIKGGWTRIAKLDTGQEDDCPVKTTLPFVERYKDINRAPFLLLSKDKDIPLINHTSMVFPLLLAINIENMYGALLLTLIVIQTHSWSTVPVLKYLVPVH